jgi:hypothetical protein
MNFCEYRTSSFGTLLLLFGCVTVRYKLWKDVRDPQYRSISYNDGIVPYLLLSCAIHVLTGLIPSETKTFQIQNGASLSAGGESRKPCPAGDHQDLSAAGGKSGKPCPELPAAQLPPSREASGGSCQTRDQGHDLLSHHGGVQRSKKVSSVQGCGMRIRIDLMRIRIQLFLIFADPGTQIVTDPSGSGRNLVLWSIFFCSQVWY